MRSFKIKLQDKKQVAEGTMAFYFEKPAGFTFKAGQYCNWTLINPLESDAEGNARDFSLASAPHEASLMIATRMRDTAFKRALKNMTPGAEIEIRGPMGDLTLHGDAATPAVLLAGGIGVTPFRSIVLDAAYNKLPHKMLLFHSNRRPQDAPFLDLLQNIQNPNWEFVGTMTQVDKSDGLWAGETGHITKEMLARHIGDLGKPIYYVAGPPAMLKSLKQALLDGGVNESQIKSEEFEGY
jgi:ferredoxin-NADP reductase